MVSWSDFRKATLAVGPGSCSRKAAASAPPASRSNNKSNKLGALKKCTSALSYVSAFFLPKSTLALNYSKADLLKILKIFLETKS